MKIPKILIVTSLDIYEDNSSSSMTIRRFFENIPSTNIYQLICINTNDLKHGRIGYNKFCLNRSDILFYPSIKSKGKNSLLVQPIDGKISNKKSSLKHGINVFLRDTLSILPYKVYFTCSQQNIKKEFTLQDDQFILDIDPSLTALFKEVTSDYDITIIFKNGETYTSIYRENLVVLPKVNPL